MRSTPCHNRTRTQHKNERFESSASNNAHMSCHLQRTVHYMEQESISYSSFSNHLMLQQSRTHLAATSQPKVFAVNKNTPCWLSKTASFDLPATRRRQCYRSIYHARSYPCLFILQVLTATERLTMGSTSSTADDPNENEPLTSPSSSPSNDSNAENQPPSHPFTNFIAQFTSLLTPQPTSSSPPDTASSSNSDATPTPFNTVLASLLHRLHGHAQRHPVRVSPDTKNLVHSPLHFQRLLSVHHDRNSPLAPKAQSPRDRRQSIDRVGRPGDGGFRRRT